MNDLINALFEILGGLISWKNVLQILKDKQEV